MPDDRKICGILIEHTLGTCSGITYTVAGAGVNINQERFLLPMHPTRYRSARLPVWNMSLTRC